MSRKHSQAYAAFQLGKGLVGFLAGLVLATMIIIAVLLMLNSNSKRGFTKPQAPIVNQPTETLQPNGTTEPTVLTEENTITDKDHRAVEPIAGSQADTGAASAPPVQTASAPTTVTTVPEPVEPEEPIIEQPNPTQPADDPIANEPTGETGNDIPPVRPTPTPTPPTPPRVNTKTGVPDNVRPNHNHTGKSNTSAGSQTNKPRNNTGTLKQDDLNISGIDTPPKRTEPKKTEPVKPAEPKKAEPVKPTEPKKVEPTKPAEPKKAEPTKPAEPKKAEPTKPTEPKKAEPAKPAEVKPTPQQILESGNIEKARELARKQAAAQSGNTAKPKHSAVVIQAGAFSSRNAAESQRARLALLGVQAKIVETKVNGKPTYRVQTNRLEGSQANQARSVLQRNRISTLERSAD